MSTLRCSSCKEHKDPTEFRSNTSSKTGRHNECRPCDSASHARYYQRNKRKVTSATLQRKYGITIEEYERMEEEQGFACALCRSPESIEERRLAVDHDHNTGRVRGLLCFKCNTALGRVADTEQKLESLILYLSPPPSCQ
jgi:hypothetical protein